MTWALHPVHREAVAGYPTVEDNLDYNPSDLAFSGLNRLVRHADARFDLLETSAPLLGVIARRAKDAGIEVAWRRITNGLTTRDPDEVVVGLLAFHAGCLARRAVYRIRPGRHWGATFPDDVGFSPFGMRAPEVCRECVVRTIRQRLEAVENVPTTAGGTSTVAVDQAFQALVDIVNIDDQQTPVTFNAYVVHECWLCGRHTPRRPCSECGEQCGEAGDCLQCEEIGYDVSEPDYEAMAEAARCY